MVSSRKFSAGQPAAVDGQNDAMDVVRGRRCQEHRGAAEIGRLAPAPGGDAPRISVALRVAAQSLGVVGTK